MKHTLELEEEFNNENDEKMTAKYSSDDIYSAVRITLEIPAFEKCPAQRVIMTLREWEEVVATVTRFRAMHEGMKGAA